MIKYFYCSFNYWRQLSRADASRFLFLSTARTVPKDFTGIQFEEFTPSWNLFKSACQNFATSNFEQIYTKQIYSLDKQLIINKLKQLSHGKNIVFLVWESDNKSSERDIFMPWLLDIPLQDIHEFSLETELKYEKNNSNLFEI